MQVNILAEFARQLRISQAELDPSLIFIAHGGHSLTALQLVAACKQLGVVLRVAELLENHPIQDLVSRAVDTPVAALADDDGYDDHDAVTQNVLNNAFIRISPTFPPACRSGTPTLNSDCDTIPEMQQSLIRGSFGKRGNNVKRDFTLHDSPLIETVISMKWSTATEITCIGAG
jgi:hypothetical protein